MSHRDDLQWLIDEVGLTEDDALELLAIFDWAEMKRVVDRYGYPKDNADVPFIADRLLDERFVACCREMLTGRSSEIGELLADAVARAAEMTS